LIRLFDPPVRDFGSRARLHQGLSARRARERRPVHPRRDLDRHGLRAARQTDRAWELFSLLNPIRHADAEGVARYKVEPYVVAADVYGAAPHTGRGGWTWYTGAAGWMYRLLVETLLGSRSSECAPRNTVSNFPPS
jgi:hypothetical protein